MGISGQALWPGRSDVDQLYLIKKNLGNLIPRHIQIFSNNQFFRGLSVPDPGTLDPLENKFPTSSKETLDFMKGCLVMEPNDRLTCKKLIDHAYFDKDRDFLESELAS